MVAEVPILPLRSEAFSLIFDRGCLQGVPKELEEAAIVDGAGLLTKFRHVTLPMITPTLFFNLILGVQLTKEEKADLVAFLKCL